MSPFTRGRGKCCGNAGSPVRIATVPAWVIAVARAGFLGICGPCDFGLLMDIRVESLCGHLQWYLPVHLHVTHAIIWHYIHHN